MMEQPAADLPPGSVHGGDAGGATSCSAGILALRPLVAVSAKGAGRLRSCLPAPILTPHRLPTPPGGGSWIPSA
jgi:hypothetical protein